MERSRKYRWYEADGAPGPCALRYLARCGSFGLRCDICFHVKGIHVESAFVRSRFLSSALVYQLLASSVCEDRNVWYAAAISADRVCGLRAIETKVNKGRMPDRDEETQERWCHPFYYMIVWN